MDDLDLMNNFLCAVGTLFDHTVPTMPIFLFNTRWKRAYPMQQCGALMLPLHTRTPATT